MTLTLSHRRSSTGFRQDGAVFGDIPVASTSLGRSAGRSRLLRTGLASEGWAPAASSLSEPKRYTCQMRKRVDAGVKMSLGELLMTCESLSQSTHLHVEVCPTHLFSLGLSFSQFSLVIAFPFGLWVY